MAYTLKTNDKGNILFHDLMRVHLFDILINPRLIGFNVE